MTIYETRDVLKELRGMIEKARGGDPYVFVRDMDEVMAQRYVDALAWVEALLTGAPRSVIGSAQHFNNVLRKS